MNHLWQSSLFVVVVWVLTLALGTNRAAVRYWLWLAASVKFLIPFSLLVSIGSQFEWRTVTIESQPQISFVMEEIGRASVAPMTAVVAAPAFNYVPILFGIWFCGFAVGAGLWIRWWLQIRAALGESREYRTVEERISGLSQGPLPDGRGSVPEPSRDMLAMPIKISSTRMEPGVFGIFKPVLLLPEGIIDRLTPAQLEAIVAHELCHVRRRDNLTAAIHMVVETIFWFHPLVWWIRARLIDERERACDEEVLRLGNEAEVYAASILEACKLYLESPLACVSGVTGSDLKKRIEAILANRRAVRVNFSKKLLLVVAAIAAVVGPVAVGVLNAPRSWAQSSSALAFEVASVKPNKSGADWSPSLILPGGRFTATNNSVRALILNAYGISASPFLLSGGPSWIDSERYDIEAKAEANAIPAGASTAVLCEKTRLMLQVLLAERFHLTLRRDKKEMAVYELVVAKNGPMLQKSEQDCGPNETACHGFSGNAMRLSGRGVDMSDLALLLSRNSDRPVLDRTGIPGLFDVKLQWNPFAGRRQLTGDVPRSPGAEEREGRRPDFDSLPTLAEAVEQQLGLKLESRKSSVEGYVIEGVEKPSGNDEAFFRKVLWTPQAFEVASIKPTAETGRGMSLNRSPGGRFTTMNASLEMLMEFAYDVRAHQISGGPKWLESDGFDIVAKADNENPPTEDLRAMVRKLLEDRFKLAIHRETKELSKYSLVVGKGGPKLQPSGKDETRISGGGKGRTNYEKASMATLAWNLSQRLGRTVVDRTGLKGDFDFALEWAPGEDEPRKKINGVEVPPAADISGPSVFTALQEQLGLKLESTKGPVEVVVIDRVERPSGN
jgi:bla regulator protein blaR1